MDHRATAVPLVIRSPRRVGSVVAGTALLVLSLVACNSSAKPAHKAATATTTSVTPTPSPTPPPPPPKPVVWPLTGQPATGPIDRPALAVKIENSIDARPQAGLNAADMVWEEVVEGGITRYMAVYQSQVPTVIGPVRSVRPMDPSIAAPLHGILAFSGGQRPFIDAVAASGLEVLTQDSGAPGFYRVRVRPAPHNVYATPTTLWNQADPAHRAAPPPQFGFSENGQQPSAVVTGAPTGTVQLTLSGLSHPRWVWSAPDGAWLRFEGGTPAVEAPGGQLRATNVVVLRVNVVMTAYTDPAHNHVPETELSGTGAAVVASGGHSVAATWSKGGVGDPVVLTAADGTPITLAPGSTWVELVPNGTGAVATG